MLLTDAEKKQLAREILTIHADDLASRTGDKSIGIEVIRTDDLNVVLRFQSGRGQRVMWCEYEPLPDIEIIVNKCEQKFDEFISSGSEQARCANIKATARMATVTLFAALESKISGALVDNLEQAILVGSVWVRSMFAEATEEETLALTTIDVRKDYDDAAKQVAKRHRESLVELTHDLPNVVVVSKVGRTRIATEKRVLACIKKWESKGGRVKKHLLARDLGVSVSTIDKALRKRKTDRKKAE
jgi:hypothetical protein